MEFVDVLHTKGERACGQIAFKYSLDDFRPGGLISHELARHADGKEMGPGYLRCDGCGNLVTYMELEMKPEA